MSMMVIIARLLYCCKNSNFDKTKNDGEYFCSKMVVDSVSLNSWLHMWARMCQVQHDDYDGDDHDGHDHDYYGDHLDHGGRG